MTLAPRLLVPLAFLFVACKAAAPLPPKAVELNRLGVEALEAGDLETADARLELALEYNPRFVEALVNLGLVELQRGNFKRARTLIARARRLNPDVAQPHHALGVLEEREGHAERAPKHYREALAVDPGFFAARANLARVLYDAGSVAEAMVQFRRLSEVAPESPTGFVGLAECLVRLDRPTEADDAVRAGRALHPGDPWLAILDARGHLRRGDAAGAAELLVPLARGEDEIAVTALAWLATSALAQGHDAEARTLAGRALSLDPTAEVARRVVADAR